MEKKVINSKQAPAPIGPYSQAVQGCGLLFISGQIALDATGNLHVGDIATETIQVMENLKAILNEAGLDFSDVVKSTIFLLTMDNFGTVNEVYGRYFSSQAPARETVAVHGLPKGVNVEISMIAAVR